MTLPRSGPERCETGLDPQSWPSAGACLYHVLGCPMADATLTITLRPDVAADALEYTVSCAHGTVANVLLPADRMHIVQEAGGPVRRPVPATRVPLCGVEQALDIPPGYAVLVIGAHYIGFGCECASPLWSAYSGTEVPLATIAWNYDSSP